VHVRQQEPAWRAALPAMILVGATRQPFMPCSSLNCGTCSDTQQQQQQKQRHTAQAGSRNIRDQQQTVEPCKCLQA
jgi:hypothetical protein